jgi:hypothetical protein
VDTSQLSGTQSVDFSQFSKLQQPHFLERTVEVEALMGGRTSRFRVEAFRRYAGGPGDCRARVYRYEDLGNGVGTWSELALPLAYRETPDQALEMALAALQQRCD